MSKVGWQFIVAAAVLLFGTLTVSCYGRSRYEEGKREGRIISLDATRKAQQRAIDSTKRSLEPAFTNLVRERDELQTKVVELQRTTAAANQRARSAQQLADALTQEERARSDVHVLAALDSLRVSNADLVVVNASLQTSNLALSTHSDSVSALLSQYRDLQKQTQVALDSANTEIAVVKKQKKPARCGFKCGVVSTLGVLAAVVTAVFVASH